MFQGCHSIWQSIVSQILSSTSVVIFAPLLSLAIEAELTPLFCQVAFIHVFVNQHFPTCYNLFALSLLLLIKTNYIGLLIFWIKHLVQKTVSTVLLVPGKADHMNSFFLILRRNKGHTLCLLNNDYLTLMGMVNKIFDKILFNGIALFFILRLR